MTTREKVAKATRTGGNTYDVSYPGGASFDRGVPGEYLVRLTGRGYRVEVDNSHHRGPGEPKTETMPARRADES